MFLNKKIIFPLLNFIFFVVVAGFLYKNIYCKKEILYNERCSVYKRFVSINKQIDDFSTIKMKIAEQEGVEDFKDAIRQKQMRENDIALIKERTLWNRSISEHTESRQKA